MHLRDYFSCNFRILIQRNLRHFCLALFKLRNKLEGCLAHHKRSSFYNHSTRRNSPDRSCKRRDLFFLGRLLKAFLRLIAFNCIIKNLVLVSERTGRNTWSRLRELVFYWVLTSFALSPLLHLLRLFKETCSNSEACQLNALSMSSFLICIASIQMLNLVIANLLDVLFLSNL